MPNYWPSRSVLRWMSVVRNRESIETWCYSVLSVTVDMFFVLDFFISLMCVWLEKTTLLFIYIHKRVKSIVFAVAINSAMNARGSSDFNSHISLDETVKNLCPVYKQMITFPSFSKTVGAEHRTEFWRFSSLGVVPIHVRAKYYYVGRKTKRKIQRLEE